MTVSDNVYRMNPLTIEIADYQNSINSYANALGYGVTPSADVYAGAEDTSLGVPMPSNVSRGSDGIESLTTSATKWPWGWIIASGALAAYFLFFHNKR